MITYFFKTYGCQANVADSQGVSAFLDDLGCAPVDSESLADLIIVNTCAIRDKAEQKLFSYLGTLVVLKANKPYQKLGVIGCVASYKKRELYNNFPHVDFVYGAREEIQALKAYLYDLVQNIETTKKLYETNQETFTVPPVRRDKNIQKVVERKRLLQYGLLKPFNSGKKQIIESQGDPAREVRRSFINIMTGCNKYCSYCIVPFTRGREVSFPMEEIIAQVRRDLMLGAKEITLIGQNVNSYIDPITGARFPVLMERIAQIPGEFWVRFISPHPQDMSRDLFEVMARYREKLVAFLHFPLQSGSNRILQAMNRTYSIEEYLEKIAWIRELLPDATITTDIIVGFPGETEEDYKATRNVMELVRYDLIYSFVYSRRKYTKAFTMEDNCSIATKEERLEALQKRQVEICQLRNEQLIGRRVKALVEKRLTNDKLLARTEGNVRVLFAGPDDLIGSFVELNINEAKPVNVYATLVA